MGGSDIIEADHVVVGAGSAGCAAAARLSEDPRSRVVLLEAGGPARNPWLHIPIGYAKTMFNPSLGWGYATEPEKELNDRRINWPRGRVMGGSSAINGLVYMRGQAEDFDHWRQLGCTGWSFEDVLPVFRRSEDQQRGADAFHGTGGPLAVSDLPDRHKLCDAFIAAAEELGMPRNDDFNGATQEGAGYFQLTTRNGLRCSAATGYLKPARRRANLRIEQRAFASRVLLEGGRAAGVAFTQNGMARTVRVRGEVILAGGSINSPQLLMLSGIGPAAGLQQHGIAVALDSPEVGRNLQDHFQARIVLRCNRPITLNDTMRSLAGRIGIGLQYALARRGPLTISAGQACLFARTRPELATPDIQFHFLTFSADRPGGSLHPFSGFTMSVCQLRPESRGEITLASNDPQTAPRIRANYLATENDRRTIVDGLQLARRLASTRALAPLIEGEHVPGPQAAGDAGLLAHARAAGTTIFHPTSTCRMGGDDRSVVDPQLRVRGIGHLRVADASIMPTVVSGNTNAAAIMIGERVADFVRAV